MDPALYASSMVMWQETVLTPSLHNPTTEEEEILEEEEAEGAIEINIRTKKEIDSYNCLSTLPEYL